MIARMVAAPHAGLQRSEEDRVLADQYDAATRCLELAAAALEPKLQPRE